MTAGRIHPEIAKEPLIPVKRSFFADFAIDKVLFQNQGQSIFVANVQTLDWSASGVYRMATIEEMREIGCYILEQGADGLNWYSWGDNSGWQGLNHFPNRWSVIAEVEAGCGLEITPRPTEPQPTTPSTPSPTQQPLTVTPTLTQTLQPSQTPIPVGCLLSGDYNNDGFINQNDFSNWLLDYLAGDTTLVCFEYWRRASFAPGVPTTTPLPTGGPTVTSGPTIPPGERKLKYYGVEAVAPGDFATLAGLGVDTVVAIFGTGNQSQWQSFLTAAAQNNIKMIVWPLGPGVCGGLFPWQKSGDSWDISAAHSMLDFMAENEEWFVAITISHEPQWSCQMSNEDMATFRRLIKEYVQDKHGKEITVTGKINGVKDNWTGEITDIAKIWMYCTTGGAGGRGAEGDCQTALDGSDPYGRSAKQARETIGRNGWDWELIFQFESFGMGGMYTMPSAAEMREWGCKFVQSGFLDGFIWYTWQNEAGYSEYLAKDHYDAAGEDRWEAVKYIKENCVE